MKKSRTRMVGARLSALLAAGALTLIIAVPAASQTDAGWIDPEYASAGVSTITVPSLARPTCTQQKPVPDRTTATITWLAPPGGLPSGMLYEIRTNNIPYDPNKTKSVFQSAVSYTYSDPVGQGNPHPDGTVLSVEVFVVIPNSMTTPTTAVWQSLNPPSAWKVTYDRIDISRGSFFCTGG